MKKKRLLYLGGTTQISKLIESICNEYLELRAVYYGTEECCDDEQLSGLDFILIDLMLPWNVEEVVRKVKSKKLPIIGVHTFDNSDVIDNYLQKGITMYIPLFDLEDKLKSNLFE